MSIDPNKYRQVLGHFPTGVTVITATTADGTPVGFTIGSFTSVSLDPPLVAFLPMTTSKTWSAIESSGSFCVNILGADQSDLCWRFASSKIETPFEGVDWQPSAISGSPVLPGAIAWIDCSIEQVIEAGDHHLVLGRVLELEHVDPSAGANALVFFRGKVGDFRPHA